MYKLWETLEEAKKLKWVELSHSLNNDSPYWSGIPEGSVELCKVVFDWGNPMLDCRLTEFKNPVRILPDSLASLSPESRIAQSAHDIRTIVMHTDAADPARLEQLHACGVETLACKEDNGRVDLPDMLERLGALGIDSLLVEGGQELNGSFVDQGLVDEYYFFVAPKILGGRDALSPVGGNGFAKMADARDIDIDSIRHFGPDFLLHGYPVKK